MTGNASSASVLFRYGLVAALFFLCLGRPVAARTLNGYGMPIGAFLRRPAPSVSSLTWQLANDKLVGVRYARLFHMSPLMVHRAFGTLRLTRLKQNRVLQVFYVRSGERIGYRLRRVRKGTLIYELPDGTPLLLRLCGNPIHKVLSTQRSAPLISVPEYAPYEPLPATTFATEATPLLRRAAPPDFVEVAVAAPNKLSRTPVVSSNKLPVVAGTHLSNWAWGIVPIIIGSIGGSSGGPSPVPTPILPPAPQPRPGPPPGLPPILPPAPQPRPGPSPVPENNAAILMVTAGAMGLLLFRAYRGQLKQPR